MENEKILINGDIYVNIHLSKKFYSLEYFQNLVAKLVVNENDLDFDYESNFGFYKLMMLDDCIFLQNQFDEDNDVGYSYKSLDLFHNLFINLKDFVAQAYFIGRYLEPTKVDLPRYIALLEYEDFLIVQDAGTGEFTVGHKVNFEDYVMGNISEPFTKKEIYQAIIDQEFKKGLTRN